ncbi:restriction endonuclease [Neobacillus niacini]|uniref:restriction endonuclease n=1 Tax=Neobacillus niacini TaxID=86668 RepID=UPI001C8D5B0A|nr:restriction endonuclease [Neobacillus niacini]MBY0149028.1 restriction endonuclease [Neobacillus niacini]
MTTKRRTKKQLRELENNIKLILLLLTLASLYLTRGNITVTILIVAIAGLLIIFLFAYKSKREKERLRNSRIEEIDSMDGIQFEYYLKELYLSRGYGVEVTSASGDYGADLLLKKNGKKIVAQAKRYSKDVGIKAVQEVIGARSYFQSDEAWVVSNSYYTKAAKELAQKGNVLLVDRNGLIDFILELNSGGEKLHSVTITKSETSNNHGTCSKCGSPMNLKKGKRGEFLGCSSFPKCRYTKNVG